MQYSFIAGAILALSSSVFAQTAGFAAITIPTQDQKVEAGSTLDITWQPTAARPGPITIQLLQGATPSTLEVGQTVAASIDQTTGKFSWTVPKDLPSFATYGFKIILDSTKTLAASEQIFQFSFPFHVTGLGGSTSSSASVSASAGGTTTVKLSTGTGYKAVPTPTSVTSYVASSYVASSYAASSHVASSAASVNSTSAYVQSTTSAAAGYPTSYPAVQPTGYSTGNVTLATTLKPTTSGGSGSTPVGASGTPTGTAPATVTANSASNLARGGLAAAAGMVIALAL